MRKTLLAAVVWLAVLAPGFAKADPLLTPLLATVVAGSVEIAGTSVALASIAPYSIKAPSK